MKAGLLQGGKIRYENRRPEAQEQLGTSSGRRIRRGKKGVKEKNRADAYAPAEKDGSFLLEGRGEGVAQGSYDIKA